ncbi:MULTISPECIES: HEAT repeat domain-containing protein [unclassified Synechocystis]|uniref:HEAT repeat domain-containing protein n=1 Tax=unclassified Synechocystis TaxID=2640012 RepID=UPI00056EDA31|nr:MULTISPECIES: HEAT repeat domain-containing protein [unclassified Synechocystis]MCT0253600.1 HEAT repeat domain-containing protein [Synechocystis sp. CS-94]
MSEPNLNPAYTLDQAIANLQQTEDASARYYAAWWIGRFRAAQPETIAALLVALEDETDRSPDGGYPLRRNAAKALGKLGDRQVVPALIKALDCDDYYVRESAAQALEGLGDNRAIEPLMAKLRGGLEAAQLVEGKPHLAQPYEAIIEALGTLQATPAIGQIEPFLEHFSAKVQYAAARALFQLTGEHYYGDRLISALGGTDLQLRRSAMMDLGATGYLPGAQAIAKTFAENSLKLIALRDLWSSYRQGRSDSESLTPASVEILTLMDSLL